MRSFLKTISDNVYTSNDAFIEVKKTYFIPNYVNSPSVYIHSCYHYEVCEQDRFLFPKDVNYFQLWF